MKKVLIIFCIIVVMVTAAYFLFPKSSTPNSSPTGLSNQATSTVASASSTQTSRALSCGNELPLNEITDNQTSTTLVSIPVYKITPATLTGIDSKNAAKNQNIDQKTLCDNFVIEQNNDGLTITDSSGKKLYQGHGGGLGMYLDNLSVFQYQNKDYFIASGGDCGNQYCNYSYYILSIDSAGNVTPFNRSTTYSTGRTITEPLWTSGNPVGETIYAQGNNIYVITGDGNYLNAIVLNTNGTIENTVSGGATSTNPAGVLPPQVEKLLEQPTACLATGTRIAMVDGSYKNIEDIETGDSVKTDNKEVATVIGVIRREDPIVVINNSLRAAPDEIIYLANGQTETADHIKSGDMLLGEDNKTVIVTTVVYSSEPEKTYDLTLAGADAFFANGYLVRAFNSTGSGR
jgi:hypothetical protein